MRWPSSERSELTSFPARELWIVAHPWARRCSRLSARWRSWNVTSSANGSKQGSNTRRNGTKSGKAIGRPKRIFARGEVIRLRASGLVIERIARQMRLGIGTVARVIQAHDDATACPSKALHHSSHEQRPNPKTLQPAREPTPKPQGFGRRAGVEPVPPKKASRHWQPRTLELASHFRCRGVSNASPSLR